MCVVDFAPSKDNIYLTNKNYHYRHISDGRNDYHKFDTLNFENLTRLGV